MEKVIEASPDQIGLHIERAKMHTMAKEYDRAINDYTKAIKLDPERNYLYYDRALVYRKIGSPGDALADIEKAAELGHFGAQKLLKDWK
ncbi:tetratricopeptide repeat protein [Nitrospirota bacterium]